MGDWEKECLDCGWRGMTAELEAAADKSGLKSEKSCPDCGGSEFKDRSDSDDN
jgi:hypothetical protein